MVTFADLFAFVMMIISLLNYVSQKYKENAKEK